MKNIAVLVSGGGTNLQALIDAQSRGEIKNGKIALVISSKPDAKALERADKHNIKSAVISKKDFEGQEEYDKKLNEILIENSIDCIVLAGFLSILSENFLKEYENKVINIHPSLIPSFCGAGFYGLRVHESALEYGVKLTGATAHFVTAEPDAGPVILQKAIEIQSGDTPEALQQRVMREAEWIILPQAVSLFCENRLKIQGRIVEII